MDTEARAEGGKKAPTLVSRCGLLAVPAEVDSVCEGTPRGAEIVGCLPGVKGGYLEAVDPGGAELLHNVHATPH